MKKHIVKTMAKTYEQGFKDGRNHEAQITLDNLYIILDDLSIQVDETSHLMSCIRDLEKDLGVEPREERP